MSVGETSPEKKEILQKFAEFCSSEEAVKRADEFGFNGMEDYVCEYDTVPVMCWWMPRSFIR